MTERIIVWMVAGFILGSVFYSVLKGLNASVAANSDYKDSFIYMVLFNFIDTFMVNGVLHIGGEIFIRGLKMLVVPLVTFSLISGVCGMHDIKSFGLRRFNHQFFVFKQPHNGCLQNIDHFIGDTDCTMSVGMD